MSVVLFSAQYHLKCSPSSLYRWVLWTSCHCIYWLVDSDGASLLPLNSLLKRAFFSPHDLDSAQLCSKSLSKVPCLLFYALDQKSQISPAMRRFSYRISLYTYSTLVGSAQISCLCSNHHRRARCRASLLAHKLHPSLHMDFSNPYSIQLLSLSRDVRRSALLKIDKKLHSQGCMDLGSRLLVPKLYFSQMQPHFLSTLSKMEDSIRCAGHLALLKWIKLASS